MVSNISAYRDLTTIHLSRFNCLNSNKEGGETGEVGRSQSGGVIERHAKLVCVIKMVEVGSESFNFVNKNV